MVGDTGFPGLAVRYDPGVARRLLVKNKSFFPSGCANYVTYIIDVEQERCYTNDRRKAFNDKKWKHSQNMTFSRDRMSTQNEALDSPLRPVTALFTAAAEAQATSEQAPTSAVDPQLTIPLSPLLCDHIP